MVDSPDWDLIRIFLSIQRAGSFAGAAQTLGIDESTVRRRLSQLERQLGTQLFARVDGRIQFLDHNRALADLARQMEASSEHFLDCAQRARNGGAVRVSVLDLFAIHFAPDLALFQQQNKEVLLDISTEPYTVDLGRDDVDIAIRMARPLRGKHKLRRLTTIGFGLYGSKDYLKRNARKSNGEHSVIALAVHFEYAAHEVALFEDRWLRDTSWLGSVAIQTDCYPAMLRLCEAGSGLALLPHFLARQSALLVRHQGTEIDVKAEVWGLVRQEVAALPKVRRVMELFQSLFRERIES